MSGLIDHATVREHIDYDPATGRILWRVGGYGRYTEKWRQRIAGTYSKKTGHGYIQINKHRYPVPRIVFFYMTGKWPNRYVVHKNGNAADNRWENLMEADTPRAGVSHSSIYESVTWRTEEDLLILSMISSGKALVSVADVLGRSLGSVKSRKRKLKKAGFFGGVPE